MANVAMATLAMADAARDIESVATINVPIFVPHAGCPHRCGFCDQGRISGTQAIPDDGEIAALLAAAAESVGKRTHGRGACQIAFFGGSFTAIPRGEMLRLLRAVRPFLMTGVFGGVRVSTRPDAIDGEVLELLREHGVAAIELGAQSMDDRVLAASGRGHTADHVIGAAERIRAHGFELGLQMMTGLPLSDDETDRASAEAIAALMPDTVRIYPTLVLENTPFADMWRRGEYAPQTLDAAVSLCGELLERFSERGIPVIRLGLHDSPDLSANLLAGPYHPAFRELCEGAVLLRKAQTALEHVPAGDILLTVASGAASKMAGQNRRNTVALTEMSYRVKIVEDPALSYLEVRASSRARSTIS